ncbi:sphingomyelin phosphodiesterase [Spizellomyces sp. 'palustris']|nr:sphingomyelin phosphodiesterase [Spizellomyces sp. 'palustris']
MEATPNHPLARLVAATDLPSFFVAVKGVEAWLKDNPDSTRAKPLHRFLSRITAKLFSGGGTEPCYILRPRPEQERLDFLHFLHPSGIFLRTLLKLNQSDLIYEIKFDQLPAPSRRLISNSDWSQLPAIYKNHFRLEQQRQQPFLQQRNLSPTVGSPRKGGQSSKVEIVFNMFEYYIFSFALCATQKSDSPSSYDQTKLQPNTPSHGLLSSIHLPKAVAGHWQRDTKVDSPGHRPSSSLNPVFFDLVQAYLDFFLPLSGNGEEYNGYSGLSDASGLRKRQDARGNPLMSRPPLGEMGRELNQLRDSFTRAVHTVEHLWKTDEKPGQIGSPRIASRENDNLNIFTIRELDLSQKRLASEFVIGAFVELWLCQNDAGVLSSPVQLGQPTRNYVKPTETQMVCIDQLINQIVSADFYRIFRGTSDRDQDYLASELLTARVRAYQIFQPNFYWFLRLAFDYWPRDDSISMIIDVWLTYVTPWKRSSPDAKYSNNWAPFIQDNFMFYTVLFGRFLNRAKSFDVYSSVRPVSSVAGTKTFNKNYLNAVEKVFAAFNDDMLIQSLRAIESSIFSLNESDGRLRSRSGGNSDPNEPHSNAGHGSLSRMYDFRSKMLQIGEKYDYPVFTPDRGQSARSTEQKDLGMESATGLLRNLVDSRERLKIYLEGDKGAGPTTGRTANGWLDMSVFLARDDDRLRPRQNITTANQETARENITRLETTINAAVAIWSGQLQVPEPVRKTTGQSTVGASPPSSRRTSASDQELLGHEEVVFKSVAPGVLAPEERVRSDGVVVLTSRGRDQLKAGLRMSSKDNIPIFADESVGKMVKTYESSLLVWFWTSLAHYLDKQYAILQRRNPGLPDLPSFEWLRCFAHLGMEERIYSADTAYWNHSNMEDDPGHME